MITIRQKASPLILNAKTSVCNAAENLLIHQNALSSLPKLAQALHEQGVELRVDRSAKAALLGQVFPWLTLVMKTLAKNITI